VSGFQELYLWRFGGFLFLSHICTCHSTFHSDPAESQKDKHLRHPDYRIREIRK
jgi:hypothetical protein